jgi:hypothetical protein
LTRIFLVALASVLLLLVVSPAIANAFLGTPVTCYLATQPVTIDGKWTTKSEWNDTAETKLLVEGTLEGYFRIKHDSSWLYVLADLPGDTLSYSLAKQHGVTFKWAPSTRFSPFVVAQVGWCGHPNLNLAVA